jgi:hypothetical protein
MEERIMKYSAESIKSISFHELLSLICKELKDAGYKLKAKRNGIDEYQDYEPYEDLIIVDVIRDVNALNYLKQIGLLDNGRCPECGRVMDNKYTFTNGFNHNAFYHICKNCHGGEIKLQNQMSPRKNNSGCMLCILILIVSSLGLFFACNQQTAVSLNESSDVTINDEGAKLLPEGWSWGKVEPYVGKNKTEKNIMSQIASYNNALLRGDINGAASYLYPDAITYFKKYYPDSFTDDDIVKEFYKPLSDAAISLNGMDIEFIVCKIDKIIETNRGILCVFRITTQTYCETDQGEKYSHSTPIDKDYIVGISFNKGQNWFFMAINEDTPNILRLKFSNDIITKVMGY